MGIMTLDHRDRLTEPVREAVHTAVSPVHFTVNLPFEISDYLSETLATRRALQQENSRLRDQQLLNAARLQRLDELERENIRLQGLLDSSYEVEESVVIAELMRLDLNPHRHVIQLDKGSRDGAFAGQPVLDAHGVVGQVDTVGRGTSVVRLLTDPSHGIAVQVTRNGLRTVAMGSGNLRKLELPHLPNNADIEVGDRLVTSGLDDRFPRGYPVAEVTEVRREPGLPFARVIARPYAELDRSREMLLVRTTREQAEDPELPAPQLPAEQPPEDTVPPAEGLLPGMTPQDRGTPDTSEQPDAGRAPPAGGATEGQP
ncbi:rod shape-determining protein MreC [Methylonatrum kenyense]|nr:rod shape-determining protein MreC [Methylonatrum kenyense]